MMADGGGGGAEVTSFNGRTVGSNPYSTTVSFYYSGITVSLYHNIYYDTVCMWYIDFAAALQHAEKIKFLSLS